MINKPSKGEILIDGISLSEIDNKSWRNSIGFVSQSPFIFGTSILNNIKVGKRNASIDEVTNAASQ